MPQYQCEYLHITIPDGAKIGLSDCGVCGRKIWDGAHLTSFSLNGDVIGASLYCPEHCSVCAAERKHPNAKD